MGKKSSTLIRKVRARRTGKIFFFSKSVIVSLPVPALDMSNTSQG